MTDRTVTIPPVTIARHETFHIRDSWLLKGLRALRRDPLALSSGDAHHELGVGKNMLTAIRYWVQATGLAAPPGERVRGRIQLEPTEAGAYLLEHDEFLEDIGTLWLLHINLASNEALATFWYWAFNEMDEARFDEEDLSRLFTLYARSLTHEDPNENSIRKDVAVFLRTYRRSEAIRSVLEDSLDCPLAALGLIQRAQAGKGYQFALGPKSNLPTDLVSYTALRFRERVRPEAEIISIDDLRWLPLSPGRLLGLDLRALMEALERVEDATHGAWLRVSYTAGLRNVHFGAVTSHDVMKHYYETVRNERN